MMNLIQRIMNIFNKKPKENKRKKNAKLQKKEDNQILEHLMEILWMTNLYLDHQDSSKSSKMKRSWIKSKERER